MSKTSQRKKSLFDQGYQDGVAYRGQRWRKHPHMAEYLKGYKKGMKDFGWR